MDPRNRSRQSDISISIGGVEVPQSDSLRYLGVILDRKLSFSQNAEALCARAKAAIGALWRTVGRAASRDIFADIYLRKIMPILLYALPVACPTDKQHWVSLEKVHRFAARLCTNNYLGSYEQILHSLHWKPVSRLCFERQALLFHKYVNGIRFLPENVIIPRNMGPRIRRSLRESVSHELQMQLNDGIFADGRAPLRNKNFPLYFASSIWNHMPLAVAQLDLVDFKRHVRNVQSFNVQEAQQLRFNTANPPLQ